MKKRKVMFKRMRGHLIFLVGLFTILFGYLAGVLIYLNVANGEKYAQKVLETEYQSEVVPYKRGDIFDRNGSVVATSNKVYDLILEPKNIIEFPKQQQKTTEALQKYFHLPDDEIKTILSKTQSYYEVVRKGLTYDDVKDYLHFSRYEKEESQYVVGIKLSERYVRSYPNDELGCHLLGFVISGNTGVGGVEGSYNSYLNGQNGRKYSYMNEDYTLQSNIEPPIDGCSLITTMDTEIQRIVQDKADKYMEEIGARNISVLVMDPADCEILALYNCHQYNPNNAYSMASTKFLYERENKTTVTDEQYKAICEDMDQDKKSEYLNTVWRNFIVSDAFEPGSTFKTFTISGAIEEGVIKPDDTFLCDGHQQVYDANIFCVNHNGHGVITVEQALTKSCNDVLMQIAAMEGPTMFDKYQRLYGFGQRTNVDITGEPSSADMIYMVYNRDRLNPVELATSSFGQGVTVTMMQLGTAFCSAINGGYYYQPHVVKQIIDADGNVVQNFDKVLVRRTISEETSAAMRKMLYETVETGTGKRGWVEGYQIGGKTGTAEKLPRGNKKYVLSFIGCCPVDDPQVVVYCVVDEPQTDDPATSGAGTVLFKEIAEELLPYMNIYKTGTDNIEIGEEDNEIAGPIFDGDAPDVSIAGPPIDMTTQSETTEESAGQEGASEEGTTEQ